MMRVTDLEDFARAQVWGPFWPLHPDAPEGDGRPMSYRQHRAAVETYLAHVRDTAARARRRQAGSRPARRTPPEGDRVITCKAWIPTDSDSRRTKTADDEWTLNDHSPSSVYTLSSRELCLSDGTLPKSWTLTLPEPQSPTDPQEHPLIRVYAFKGEELDKPIDTAWHDELFVSFREESFPDGSDSAFRREVTRWTPLEVRVVEG